MSPDIDFSIILPVCHGGKLLRETLDSIRRLDYPRERFELVVRPDWLRTLAAVVAREPDAGIIGGVDELETDGRAFDPGIDPAAILAS